MQIYLHLGNQTKGPFTLEDIRQALDDGSADPTDQVSYGNGSERFPILMLPGVAGNAPIQVATPVARQQPQTGCCGPVFTVGIIALAVLAFLGWLQERKGPDVVVNGATGTLVVTAVPTYDAKLVGTNIASEVYEVATRHPELQRLVVNVRLAPANLLNDRYGNPVSGPLNMGSVTVDDLGEVRRYRSEGAYILHNKAIFTQYVLRMNYVQYLGM